MRTGYVLKTFPRLSQTFIVNEIRAHERAGVDVTIFALKPPRAEDRDVVSPPLRAEVVELAGPREEWPAELAVAATARGITHLHAHFGNVATHVARGAATRMGVPYSFTAHALDIFADKVDQEELRRKIEDAAAVVTVSQFNVRHLESTFSRRPALVSNGLPLEDFPYDRSGREPRTILAVGRFIEKKGFGVLLDAAALLDHRGIPFRCRLIGGGPLADALQSQAHDLGIEDRVEFTGALAPAAVRSEIRRAAILAAPCVISADGDRDGLPTVLLEAMASGTPCIGTDVTGIPEVVVNGDTGLLIPPHDARALADACARLLDDQPLADRCAAGARRLIEAHFDSDRTAAQLRDVWAHPARRVLFRIHNRRGLGHWMRSSNLAQAILEADSATDVLFYARRDAPPSGNGSSVRHVRATDPDRLDLHEPAIRRFAPHVIVDDTMLPETGGDLGARRVFIMRERSPEQFAALLESPALRAVDLVVIPHARRDFGLPLPAWLESKAVFAGPIVRSPDPGIASALARKYELEPGTFVLVSTPGGGGFEEDAKRLFGLARAVHRRLAWPHLRHIVVRGPNAIAPMTAPDGRMTVVDTEPELASLLSIADAVISAGGYNTVNEIRLARVPAFFLPGQRKYDDQAARVRGLERDGLGWVLEGEPDAMATHVTATLRDSALLARCRAACARDVPEPGNRLAAERILQCARP